MARESTSIKDAIKQWETEEFERRRKEAEKRGETYADPVRASEEEVVCLIGVMPPITRMDKELLSLKNVRHLALSTNAIDKIAPGLRELEHLEVLSLGRNQIKKLENLDLPNLRELWISYNKIDKLSGLDKLKRLSVLYITNNAIASWTEVERNLTMLPELVDLCFVNNPLERGLDKHEYRIGMLMRLPGLGKLDGRAFEPEEREEAERAKDA
jgi:dynein light chain 1